MFLCLVEEGGTEHFGSNLKIPQLDSLFIQLGGSSLGGSSNCSQLLQNICSQNVLYTSQVSVYRNMACWNLHAIPSHPSKVTILPRVMHAHSDQVGCPFYLIQNHKVMGISNNGCVWNRPCIIIAETTLYKP